jgi:predicted permease
MRALTRLLNFATRRRGDQRLREEIESHLANLAEENIRAGMTLEEARRQARLKFGAVDAVREDYHAEEGLPFFENLLLDARYALRVLRKSPAFTIVALLTLMLGIGANVVVFGVLNAVLLDPLYVSDPQNLYQIRHKPWMSGRLLTTSYGAFEDFQQRNTTFGGMAGIYGYSHAALSWRNAVRKVHGDEVTGNYFDLLGVEPALGRFFHAPDEHGPDSAPYVVLSDALWRSAFHADRGVVGETVELNKHPFTVIGVAPARFHGTERFLWPDYWMPMANEGQVEGWDYLHSRTSITVTVIGRLKPGVTPRQATGNLNAIAAELAKEYPETDDGQPLRLIHPGLLGDDGDVIRGFLYSVTLLALLVLAAACANLATLFAARAADRSRELALRVALGSSRWRLMKQLLTEAVMVSLAGGAAGLVSARLLLGVLNRSQPFAGQLTVSVDARVYLAALALTLASALLFGMVPAWQTTAPANRIHLRRFALRDLLLGAQIAICTLLVTASLVAARGMVRALHAPLGFQPQGAMLADVDLSQAGDVSVEKKKAMIEAARSIPGVTAAGTVSRTPFTGGLHGIPIFRPGTTEFKLNNSVLTTYAYQMSPGYLEAAGTRLLGGRDVSWHDTAETPYVAIVNETFARKMWGGTPAIGQRFIVKGNLTEVVGVVAKRAERNGLRGAVAAGAERDGGGARTHAERHRAECANHSRELARFAGGGAVPGTGGDSGAGHHGPARGDAGGDRHLRNGGLQREPADEGTGHPRGIGRAQDAGDDRGGRAAHAAARRGIGAGSGGGNLREPPAGADRLSGESARSGGAGRRGADDGPARRCGVRHSRRPSAGRRSIQTHAGRVSA